MNLKFIADKLTTELTGQLNYIVTDDIQYYNNDIKDGGLDYVPVVITITRDFVEQVRHMYNQTYVLKFHVREELRDTFEADIKNFVDNQTTETIDSYYVQKMYQALRMTDDITINGVDYFVYEMESTWTYSLSIIGSYLNIRIDDIPVPYRTISIVHDIAYVSNQSRLSNYRMTNDTVVMEIPLILSNTKVLEIYSEINSDYYNKIYTVLIHDVTKTLVLKKAEILYNSNVALSTMRLTLETHYPRVAITLDGAELPITSYSYEMKKQNDTAAKVGSNLIKGYATGKVRVFSITFVKSDSAIYTKIVNDAYGDLLDTTYTLIRDGVTYTLTLSNARETYTETGDMAIECQFNDYGS